MVMTSCENKVCEQVQDEEGANRSQKIVLYISLITTNDIVFVLCLSFIHGILIKIAGQDKNYLNFIKRWKNWKNSTKHKDFSKF